jgi:hypothetical protein
MLCEALRQLEDDQECDLPDGRSNVNECRSETAKKIDPLK